MVDDEARALLIRMTAASIRPELDDGDIGALLDLARRPDRAGCAPDEAGWVPTFELYCAAAEGWRWKAGRAVPDYSFGIDDQTARQSDIYKHCLSQVRDYEAKAEEAARRGGNYSLDTLSELNATESS